MDQLGLPEKAQPRVRCFACNELIYLSHGRPSDAVTLHYATKHPDVVCKVDLRQFGNQSRSRIPD